MSVKQHYLWVITTPRSGSEMLCRSLREAGMTNLREELKELDTTVENFIFPPRIKFFPYHIKEDKKRWENPSLFIDEILTTYPEMKFIYLLREDKIAQLTSEYIAIQHNVWGIYEEHRFSRVLRSQVDKLPGHKKVIHWLSQYRYYNQIFIKIAKQKGVPCLDVTYEELSKNRDDEWLKVFDFCGLDRKNIRKTDKYRDKKWIIRNYRKEYYEKVYNRFKQLFSPM